MASKEKKNKKYKNLHNVKMHIYSHKNTIVTIADMSGNVKKQFSCGMTYKGKAKNSDLAVTELANEVKQWLIANSIKTYKVIVRGTGLGVSKLDKFFVPKLGGKGPECLGAEFVTSIEYGGCKKQKTRRG